MKKLILFILLVSSIKIFSQEIASEEVNIDAKSIYEKVDKMPEYPGGINSFREKFSQTFSVSRINNKGEAKSEVQFVISQDGSITDIIAFGDNLSMNKEMERTIRAMSKIKWKPAEISGQAVRYKFKLPITMNIN
jgi:hypothetical protein